MSRCRNAVDVYAVCCRHEGRIGAEKKERKKTRAVGYLNIYSSTIKKRPNSDVPDTDGKQKPMGLEITGAFLKRRWMEGSKGLKREGGENNN